MLDFVKSEFMLVVCTLKKQRLESFRYPGVYPINGPRNDAASIIVPLFIELIYKAIRSFAFSTRSSAPHPTKPAIHLAISSSSRY